MALTWRQLPGRSFSKVRKEWEHINFRGSRTPLLDVDFLEPALEVFGSGEEVVLVAVEEDDPVAAGVFAPARLGAWQTFQPSQAPIGAWVQLPDLSSAQAVQGLFRRLPGFPIQISLTQQDPDIVERPPDEGRCITLDYIDTGRVNCSSRFDEYWESRGKNLRHNLKRQRNRLEREGIRTSLRVVDSPDEVRGAVKDYGRLETAGWKGKEGTAINIDNEQGRFYEKMLRRFAEGTRCRIYQYYYNEDLVASDICIMGGGVAVVLKTTFDEVIQNSSPAFLMRQEYFARLFADETVDTIEFYGKVMDWHTKWTDDFRKMFHVNFYRNALVRRMLGAR